MTTITSIRRWRPGLADSSPRTRHRKTCSLPFDGRQRGENAYSPQVLRRLVDCAVRSRTSATPLSAALPELSERERDALGCLGLGLTNLEIAARLHIGVTTVKTHVANLMERTGSPNRVHLAILAVRQNLVPEADPHTAD
ncbi:LuxR C-terminal-related transcriptional regulator [Modestobacter caceresii]|uniref:LuxR C-terminal-related transcriptional regulator n=1 Tax=Modestobacter caceresii TaxID=1522368 RepID=UPI000A7B2440|nr:LuxR C-terminal-related transcriptional regulator [Modestobacter caceresii]